MQHKCSIILNSLDCGGGADNMLKFNSIFAVSVSNNFSSVCVGALLSWKTVALSARIEKNWSDKKLKYSQTENHYVGAFRGLSDTISDHKCYPRISSSKNSQGSNASLVNLQTFIWLQVWNKVNEDSSEKIAFCHSLRHKLGRYVLHCFATFDIESILLYDVRPSWILSLSSFRRTDFVEIKLSTKSFRSVRILVTVHLWTFRSLH